MSLNNAKSGDGGASSPAAETNGSKNAASVAAAATTTAARSDGSNGDGGGNIAVLYPVEPTTIRKSVLSKAITTAINERLERRKK